MPTGPMPDISSPQFMPWLQAQDPMTQQAVMRAIGMDQASGNPVSAQGMYAPEMNDMAYDLPSMVGGIPLSTNSKGKPNPYNVETQAKRLNFAQDLTGTGGLGNNMLSWITGPQATDPTAWKPIKKGTGSPLTFENLASMEAMAGSGGSDYQSFLADQMLKGATPAGAIAALKSTIRSGQASQELLDSMPGNSQQDPAIFGGKAPDLTTDQGFTQAFDTRTLLSDANDMHKGMAKDRALQKAAYQDPTTGQFYTGYDENKTEQMQAADKLGLAYPTQSYGDKDYVDLMQQQAFGLAPGQAQYEDDRRQSDIDRLTQQIAPAQQAADKARSNQEALMKAWNDNFTAPAQPMMGAGPKPFQNFADLQAPLPGAPSAPALGGGRPGTPFTAQSSAAPYVGTHTVRPDVPVEGQAALGKPTLPADWKVVARDAQGNPLLYDTGLGSVVTAQGVGAVNDPEVLAKVASAEWEPKGSATKTQSTKPKVRVGMDGNVELAGPVDFSKLWDPAFIGSKTRELQAGDVRTAKTAADKKRKAAIDAKYAPMQRSKLSSNELDRAALATQMRLLASQGRTPLNDQLAARSQTVRNMLGY